MNLLEEVYKIKTDLVTHLISYCTNTLLLPKEIYSSNLLLISIFEFYLYNFYNILIVVTLEENIIYANDKIVWKENCTRASLESRRGELILYSIKNLL